jgi:hypothetical protein
MNDENSLLPVCIVQCIPLIAMVQSADLLVLTSNPGGNFGQLQHRTAKWQQEIRSKKRRTKVRLPKSVSS